MTLSNKAIYYGTRSALLATLMTTTSLVQARWGYDTDFANADQRGVHLSCVPQSVQDLVADTSFQVQNETGWFIHDFAAALKKGPKGALAVLDLYSMKPGDVATVFGAYYEMNSDKFVGKEEQLQLVNNTFSAAIAEAKEGINKKDWTWSPATTRGLGFVFTWLQDLYNESGELSELTEAQEALIGVYQTFQDELSKLLPKSPFAVPANSSVKLFGGFSYLSEGENADISGFEEVPHKPSTTVRQDFGMQTDAPRLAAEIALDLETSRERRAEILTRLGDLGREIGEAAERVGQLQVLHLQKEAEELARKQRLEEHNAKIRGQIELLQAQLAALTQEKEDAPAQEDSDVAQKDEVEVSRKEINYASQQAELTQREEEIKRGIQALQQKLQQEAVALERHNSDVRVQIAELQAQLRELGEEEDVSSEERVADDFKKEPQRKSAKEEVSLDELQEQLSTKRARRDVLPAQIEAAQKEAAALAARHEEVKAQIAALETQQEALNFDSISEDLKAKAIEALPATREERKTLESLMQEKATLETQIRELTEKTAQAESTLQEEEPKKEPSKRMDPLEEATYGLRDVEGQIRALKAEILSTARNLLSNEIEELEQQLPGAKRADKEEEELAPTAESLTEELDTLDRDIKDLSARILTIQVEALEAQIDHLPSVDEEKSTYVARKEEPVTVESLEAQLAKIAQEKRELQARLEQAQRQINEEIKSLEAKIDHPEEERKQPARKTNDREDDLPEGLMSRDLNAEITEAQEKWEALQADELNARAESSNLEKAIERLAQDLSVKEKEETVLREAARVAEEHRQTKLKMDLAKDEEDTRQALIESWNDGLAAGANVFLEGVLSQDNVEMLRRMQEEVEKSREAAALAQSDAQAANSRAQRNEDDKNDSVEKAEELRGKINYLTSLFSVVIESRDAVSTTSDKRAAEIESLRTQLNKSRSFLETLEAEKAALARTVEENKQAREKEEAARRLAADEQEKSDLRAALAAAQEKLRAAEELSGSEKARADQLQAQLAQMNADASRFDAVDAALKNVTTLLTGNTLADAVKKLQEDLSSTSTQLATAKTDLASRDTKIALMLEQLKAIKTAGTKNSVFAGYNVSQSAWDKLEKDIASHHEPKKRQ